MRNSRKIAPVNSGTYVVKILDVTLKAHCINDDKEFHCVIFHLAIYDKNEWITAYVNEFYDNTKDCTYYRLAKSTWKHYPQLKEFSPKYFIGETVKMRFTVQMTRTGDEYLHILYFKPLKTNTQKEENNNE